MDPYLFAGVPVSDYQRAVAWYERFLGSAPTMIPNDVEAVWDLADRRSLYVVVAPEDAGHAHLTLFLSDDEYDRTLAAVAARGLEPELVEQYENGVRKATFRDPDGNEVGLGGGPLA